MKYRARELGIETRVGEQEFYSSSSSEEDALHANFMSKASISGPSSRQYNPYDAGSGAPFMATNTYNQPQYPHPTSQSNSYPSPQQPQPGYGHHTQLPGVMYM